MSNKFEATAANTNDGQLSNNEFNSVVHAMFNCAYDGSSSPTHSSTNDSGTLSSLLSGIGNSALNRPAGSDTGNGAGDRVMTSLANILSSGTSEVPRPHARPDGSSNPLPDVNIVGNLLPFDRNRKPASGNDNGNVPAPSATPEHQNGSGRPPETPPLPIPAVRIDNANGSQRPENVAPGPAPTRIDNSNGSQRPDNIPPVNELPHRTGTPENSGRSSLPPVERPGRTGTPEDSGRSTLPPVNERPGRTGNPEGSGRSQLPPVVERPGRTGTPENSGRSTLPPVGERPGREIERPGENIDRSPKFKFPENKPMDEKTANEYAERIAKILKESVGPDGKLELSASARDRLAEALRYGINHGEQGMNDMVKLINKQLEGSGLELKTDGKPWAYYQTCFPDRRGDYHGDFISFDIQNGGQRGDFAMVKVSPGDFDRDR